MNITKRDIDLAIINDNNKELLYNLLKRIEELERWKNEKVTRDKGSN